METKTNNPNITVQFIEYAQRAEEVHHYLYCQGCGKETDHQLHCNGDWEIYTCDCGWQESVKVR